MTQRGRDKGIRGAGVGWLLLAVLVVGMVWWVQRKEKRAATTQSAAVVGSVEALPEDMLLGNPSGATRDPSNRGNYLMVKPYFALSYNNEAGEANWVSWRVTKDDLGNARRKQIFDTDTMLPEGFSRITHKDYTGSGFDRGHLCPHSDRAANEEMSFATFVMTNIIPQAPNVNEKAWANLEEYGRDLVRLEEARLYVIAGPLGEGGRGSKGEAQTLAAGKVRVPASCWKVMVVVPEGGSGSDLGKITPQTRVIAVIMPNDQTKVGEDWGKYRVSVAEAEKETGYRFFDRVPAGVREKLEEKVDDAAIVGRR